MTQTDQSNNYQVFTSDLSVNEFLLLQEAGLEPRGMVLGASIFHLGDQNIQESQNHELVLLTDALRKARANAMHKMVDEARKLGADGIVGVRLSVKHLEFNQDYVQFIAIGTAIADPGFDWKVYGMPFTSHLSGQEFWSLIHSGYRPVSLVMGNCVFHVAQPNAITRLKTMNRNVEMRDYTSAIYDAREIAMSRLQTEAQSCQALGVVGVDVHEGSYAFSRDLIEFFCLGTAISEIQSKHFLPNPNIVLSMNDAEPNDVELEKRRTKPAGDHRVQTEEVEPREK